MRFSLLSSAIVLCSLQSHLALASPIDATENRKFPPPKPLVQGDCVKNDHGLRWLASKLSCDAAISCFGSPLQQYNAGRYWGEQYGKNASVVVFPANTQDVSYTVQATSMTSLGRDFAFVSGAHGMTNASSSYGFVIDLSWMNKTRIIHNYSTGGEKFVAIEYQGGATWIDVMSTTNGTGVTAVGARVGSVGAGGFSTGGGIGFLAGAYGYATDRLRAMEVVLVSGQVVLATKNNCYSDSFWALQGGGGQFGIVTRFYQEAAPEPIESTFGVYFVTNDTAAKARENTVKFFQMNEDPFSLMYFAVAVLPPDPTSATPQLAPITVLVGVHFGDPYNSSQKNYTDTFADLLDGVNTTWATQYNLPYAESTDIIDQFFPYGFRRGFYGPQTTNVSVEYLESVTAEFNSYISAITSRGEVPYTALWALQFMLPGLNGNLPHSNDATGWPHAVAGHQTLFSPAWSSVDNDAITYAGNDVFNKLTYDNRAKVGAFIADYPNYISPGASGHRLWGDNVGRLIAVKQKYDPLCGIHNGRVFASSGCSAGGWANVFSS